MEIKQWDKRVFENLVLKESVCVQEARGVRDRLTLCSLSAIVRPCVCLSIATFFHLTCLNTFPSLPFFLASSRQLCLFHVLFCFIVCKSRSCAADFYQFQTLFSSRQLFLLCLLTHHLNYDFQAGQPVCVTVFRCVTPAHVWDRLETGINGCESHAL